MKKLFILTGEPSGDKLASKVIAKLKIKLPNVKYLSVGGDHLKSLGIESIYDLKKITFIGFTSVLFNIFKIKKKINETVAKIIDFNPDILFTVDSPDFTLRVAQRVKKINPSIKIIHYVAPQVWVWRENRTKKLKNFLDHVLLLFPFEKKYFDKENIKSTFVGHPLLDEEEKIKINIDSMIDKNKKIISIFSGSRSSEINILTPILFKFIKKMENKYEDIQFFFHTTNEYKNKIKNLIIKQNLKNCDAISEEKIKSHVLKNSIFAVSKSGTISLEICNFKIPSIIIYKMNFINFLIVKLLVKVKYANIVNIAANSEIIPELLQSKCNSNEIFSKVNEYLSNPDLQRKQIYECEKILNSFRIKGSSSDFVSSLLINNF